MAPTQNLSSVPSEIVPLSLSHIQRNKGTASHTPWMDYIQTGAKLTDYVIIGRTKPASLFAYLLLQKENIFNRVIVYCSITLFLNAVVFLHCDCYYQCVASRQKSEADGQLMTRTSSVASTCVSRWNTNVHL